VKEIKAERLTATNFLEFGTVVNTPKTDPSLSSGYVPQLATFNIDGETEIGICTVHKSTEPMTWMERHLKTMEVFISIEGDFLLAMSRPQDPADPEHIPQADAVRAFHVREGQTVVMQPGSWHAVLSLDERCSFLIIFKKDTAKDDLMVKNFAGDEQLTILL
jgi:ureidoglycolate hydrolase